MRAGPPEAVGSRVVDELVRLRPLLRGRRGGCTEPSGREVQHGVRFIRV